MHSLLLLLEWSEAWDQCLRSHSYLWGAPHTLLTLWEGNFEFLQSKERKLELSAVSPGWMGNYLCQVCILYWHFPCLPLSLNLAFLGDAGTFCDPVPEVSFCRVGINRGTPVGQCTLSITHPAKPLLPRQCPPHVTRMPLDRSHYSEKCAYAFTVQMGLLAFFGRKIYGWGCVYCCTAAL